MTFWGWQPANLDRKNDGEIFPVRMGYPVRSKHLILWGNQWEINGGSNGYTYTNHLMGISSGYVMGSYEI